MISIQDFIHSRILPLEVNQDVASVQDFFLDHAFSYFPVVSNAVYLGSVSADDADSFDFGKILDDYRYSFEGFFVREKSNWLEILEKFAQNQTDVMPILNSENTYIGYYLLSDVIQVFSQTSFLKEPGGIVVIEKNILQYSASEIVQIVESNGLKLLGLFVSEMTNVVQVYVKVNTEDLNEILQSFRRYQYEIISEHSEDLYLQSLKDRLDYIDKYLNI